MSTPSLAFKGITLVCGDHEVPLDHPLELSNYSLVTSIVGGNDLGDLGFTVGGLLDHGLQMKVNGLVVMKARYRDPIGP